MEVCKFFVKKLYYKLLYSVHIRKYWNYTSDWHSGLSVETGLVNKDSNILFVYL